jgi:hypothetical protein
MQFVPHKGMLFLRQRRVEIRGSECASHPEDRRVLATGLQHRTGAGSSALTETSGHNGLVVSVAFFAARIERRLLGFLARSPSPINLLQSITRIRLVQFAPKKESTRARRPDYSGRSRTRVDEDGNETASRVCSPFWGTTKSACHIPSSAKAIDGASTYAKITTSRRIFSYRTSGASLNKLVIDRDDRTRSYIDANHPAIETLTLATWIS